jgi:hypothetical protein
MKRHDSAQRFEVEEFEDEDFRRGRKGETYGPRRHERGKANWKRLWLDHPNDYETHDEFYGK